MVLQSGDSQQSNGQAQTQDDEGHIVLTEYRRGKDHDSDNESNNPTKERYPFVDPLVEAAWMIFPLRGRTVFMILVVHEDDFTRPR